MVSVDRHSMLKGFALGVLCFCLNFGFASASFANTFVIKNGRVMDPETGYDKISNIAINNGQIVAISTEPLKGEQQIDASGLVVSPGFVDLHAHGQDVVSNHFQAADGVTTALNLEIGEFPLAKWYESRKGKAPINYGASVAHIYARVAVSGGADSANPLSGNLHESLDSHDLSLMLDFIRAGIEDGGLGIGIGITYSPGADHEEIFKVFELASALNRPIFVHMRNEKFMNKDLLAPLQEVLSNAAVTGASLHVVHINSSTDKQAKVAVSMIRKLQARGIDVTTENYPYTAGSTRLESALFDNWENDYGDLQWVATGERLTKKTFEKYREEGGWVIIHGRSEEMNAWLVEQPDLIIASDGIPFVDGLSHPRSAGTYARILGRYVREEKRLTLMQALAKMTIMPVKRLDYFVPVMKRKGRLQVGADADITIFNPETIMDRATYTEPAQHSRGIKFVFVNGIPVIRDGKLDDDVFPGSAIRVGVH